MLIGVAVGIVSTIFAVAVAGVMFNALMGLLSKSLEARRSKKAKKATGKPADNRFRNNQDILARRASG